MATSQTSPALSTDLGNPEAVPYFLWDEPMTPALPGDTYPAELHWPDST